METSKERYENIRSLRLPNTYRPNDLKVNQAPTFFKLDDYMFDREVAHSEYMRELEKLKHVRVNSRKLPYKHKTAYFLKMVDVEKAREKLKRVDTLLEIISDIKSIKEGREGLESQDSKSKSTTNEIPAKPILSNSEVQKREILSENYASNWIRHRKLYVMECL